MTAKPHLRYYRSLTRLTQALSTSLKWITSRSALLISKQGLYVLFLLLLVFPGMWQVLRPPLHRDISGYTLPLVADTTSIANPGNFLSQHRPILLFSPGVFLALVALACGVAGLLQPRTIPWGAGLVLAVLIACEASAQWNHPRLIAELDRQIQLRESVVSMLEATAQPSIDITSFPRVGGGRAKVSPGSMENSFAFFPQGRGSFLALAMLAIVWLTGGSLLRRITHLMLWGVVGIVLGLFLTWHRYAAEWHWHRATVAEAAGLVREAESETDQAIASFPELAHLERTWLLRGTLHYQTGQQTPERSYYLARQWAQHGELSQAEQEIERCHLLQSSTRHSVPPPVDRWLADVIVRNGLNAFNEQRYEAADQIFDRALVIDPSVPQRALYLAILRGRTQGGEPQQVALLLGPALDGLADRALKAALLAMLGDCYFSAGHFAEARRQYQTSLDVYSLPKTINYRALRGLLGM